MKPADGTRYSIDKMQEAVWWEVGDTADVFPPKGEDTFPHVREIGDVAVGSGGGFRVTTKQKAETAVLYLVESF
jgi:hypothetical protein